MNLSHNDLWSLKWEVGVWAWPWDRQRRVQIPQCGLHLGGDRE